VNRNDEQLLTALAYLSNPNEALASKSPLYVECGKERGTTKLFTGMLHQIRRNEPPTCQLIGGHRGNGKTTELNRLIDELRNGTPPYVVVELVVDDYLNLSFVEAPDVLLAMVQQLWIEADDKGINLSPAYITKFLSELGSLLLSPVTVSEANIKGGILEFKAQIKNSPTNQTRVRERLRARQATLLDEVNVVLKAAEIELRRLGYKGIVMVVDNLDRMLDAPLPGMNISTQIALFVQNSDALRRMACHKIYTVPSELLHSNARGQLIGLYGTFPKVMPMIPVAHRDGSPDQAGIAKLQEIIRVRLDAAGIASQTAFDPPELLERLAVLSGGYVRNLLTALNAMIDASDHLPFTSDALAEAEAQQRNSLDSTIPTLADRERLARIAADHYIELTEEYLTLMKAFCILEYCDDKGYWYDVAPVLRKR
jgi:hypothetical protein